MNCDNCGLYDEDDGDEGEEVHTEEGTWYFCFNCIDTGLVDTDNIEEWLTERFDRGA